MKSLLENKKISIFIIVISIIFLAFIAFHPKIETKKTSSDNYELMKEKEIYGSAVPLDSIFSQLDISLKDEDIPEFINSSSTTAAMHKDFVGAMLSEEIKDEYKLAYILSRATWQAFEVDDAKMSENYGYVVSVKKETIKKLADQLFKTMNIPKRLNNGYYYWGLENIVCMEVSCYYSYTPFGLTGYVADGYEIKTVMNDSVATSQALYIEYPSIISKDDALETLTASVILKDSYNGKTIANSTSYTFKYETSPDTHNIFDEFSQYYETIPTYEYTFDSNNVLVKVAKK